jgi:tetratricopeptide (TPR) repeat protein
MLTSVLRRPWFLLLVVSLLSVADSSLLAAPPANVVILPFSNLTPTRSLDWVGESLSVAVFESLSNELGFVISPEERDETLRQMNVRKYAPLTEASVLEIGVNLDAEFVVSGSFELLPAPKDGPATATLSIRARLWNARKLQRVKDLQVTGALAELSLLQGRLAWQILTAFRPEFASREREYQQAHPVVRLDALERYVRGLMATGFDQKYRLFTAAIRLQPDYSGACYQLGSLYYARHEYRTAADWLGKVSPGDAHAREALFRLGLARYHTGEFRLSADSFAKVASVIPLSEVLNNLGLAQLRAGDARAAENLRAAAESDPADPDYAFNLGYERFRKGDFEAAARAFELVLARRPADPAAAALLERCHDTAAARPGPARPDALERLKENYDESAWRQLKAMVEAPPR